MSLIDRLHLALAAGRGTVSFDHEAPRSGATLLDDVATVASALVQLPPDRPLSLQLPTSRAAVVIHLAALATGTPIHHLPVSFRSRDALPILEAVRPTLLVSIVDEVIEHPAIAAMTDRSVLVTSDVLDDVDRTAAILGSGETTTPVSLAVLAATVDDRRPALLLATSGSTGTPKVVAHSQRGLAAAADLTAWAMGIGADDVFFSPSPPTHITGLLFGIYIPLLHAAGTAFMGRWEARDGLDIVEARSCTVAVGVPTFAIDLHAAWQAAGAGRFLRCYLTGATDVPTDRIAEIEADTGCTFLRGYGGTEVPMVSCGTPAQEQGTRLATDGLVLPPARVVVRHDGDEEGAAGELLVSGPQQGLGYYRAGALTPLTDDDGWVRLGDEGTVDEAGVVTVAGRRNEVIIRGGTKFYVPELDAMLQDLPDVADAAAFAVPDPRLGQVPAAAVVAPPGREAPDPSRISAQLSERGIARPKHPVAVLVVDALPRTPAGKVDRPALARTMQSRTEEDDG